MNNDTQLIADLVKCVDMLLPGIGHVVADAGLLNDTLITARRRVAQPAQADHTTEGKLPVTSTALRAVLEALIGPSHHIREMLATREPPELFPDNPINKLIAEFNAFHATGGAR